MLPRTRRLCGGPCSCKRCNKSRKRLGMDFRTKVRSQDVDALAPDGSEIRLLCQVNGGSMAYCVLQPSGVSLAVAHRTVEEVWYFVEGKGQVWRKQGAREEVTDVYPGLSLSIPLGTHFQFRTIGDEPLGFVIATMPPWPGADEAVRVDDYWSVRGK